MFTCTFKGIKKCRFSPNVQTNTSVLINP